MIITLLARKVFHSKFSIDEAFRIFSPRTADKVSKDEVISFSLTLADKVALNSSINSTQEIAIQLAEVITG